MPHVWFARPWLLTLLALVLPFAWLATTDLLRSRDWKTLKGDRGLAIGLRLAVLTSLVLAAAGPLLAIPFISILAFIGLDLLTGRLIGHKGQPVVYWETLLTLPILFAMFQFFPNAIELRQQSFLWAKDLSSYDVFVKLPFFDPPRKRA